MLLTKKKAFMLINARNLHNIIVTKIAKGKMDKGLTIYYALVKETFTALVPLKIVPNG